jgi:peroxiredoxin
MHARLSILKELNARLLPVSTDAPKASAKLQAKLGTDFTFLSDPQLTILDHLPILTSAHHPMAKTYPKKQFLQPGVVIWNSEGKLLFEWYIKPKLTNLFGAARRMTADEILEKAQTLL